jgi:hypothetical protein
MRVLLWGAIGLQIVAAGCSASRVERDTARQNFEQGRVYEMAGDLEEAGRWYAMVAEKFPESEWQIAAVRKAGILYAHPQNPGRNDSIALYWFRVLEAKPIPTAERELLNLQITTLKWSRNLEEQARQQRESNDSLTVVLRRLGATVVNQSRQIQALETQTNRISEELRQLKEIDLRMSRRKQGK